MKKWKVLTLCVACMAAFALSIPSDADAKRIGGGRSFGSSPSMSRPAPSAPSAPPDYGIPSGGDQFSELADDDGDLPF